MSLSYSNNRSAYNTLENLHDTVVNNKQHGDLLSWNNTSKKWVPIPASAVGATTLSGLTDVDISGVSDAQFLAYDQGLGLWMPQDKPSYNLDELGDVSVPAPSAGDLLYFDGNGWISYPVTSLPVNPHALEDHSNVTINTPVTYQSLIWSGTEWINRAIGQVHAIGDHYDVKYFGGRVDQQVLKWNPGATITLPNGSSSTGAWSNLFMDLDDLSTVAITGPIQTNSLLQYVSGFPPQWRNRAPNDVILGSINIHNDVTITSVANGDFLQWDSITSQWINIPVTSLPVNPHTIESHSDAQVGVKLDGDRLVWNSGLAKWVNQRLRIEDADDVAVSPPLVGDVLVHNGLASPLDRWANQPLGTASKSFTNLTDHFDALFTGQDQGHYIYWNATLSQWRNQQLFVNSAYDVEYISALVTNDVLVYNGVLDKWENKQSSTLALGSIAQHNDVTVSGVANGDLLQWNSLTSQWENVAATSLPVGNHNLDSHTDVTISAPANYQSLIYQSGQWINTKQTIGHAALTSSLGDVTFTDDSTGSQLMSIGAGNWLVVGDSVGHVSWFKGAVAPTRPFSPDFVNGTWSPVYRDTSTITSQNRGVFVNFANNVVGFPAPNDFFTVGYKASTFWPSVLRFTYSMELGLDVADREIEMRINQSVDSGATWNSANTSIVNLRNASRIVFNTGNTLNALRTYKGDLQFNTGAHDNSVTGKTVFRIEWRLNDAQLPLPNTITFGNTELRVEASLNPSLYNLI